MSNPVPAPGGTCRPPGQEQPGFPAAAVLPAEKKRGISRLLLGIAAVVLVAIVVIVLRSTLFGASDEAADAKAGDCIVSDEQVENEGTTQTGADFVDCGSSEAKFTVVARVDGESSPQSKSCNKFFKEKEVFFIYGSATDDGYLLCLRPKA